MQYIVLGSSTLVAKETWNLREWEDYAGKKQEMRLCVCVSVSLSLCLCVRLSVLWFYTVVEAEC